MAANTRPVRFPRQLVIMLDDKTAERIEADANARQEPKSVVARDYLKIGIRTADTTAAENDALS